MRRSGADRPKVTCQGACAGCGGRFRAGARDTWARVWWAKISCPVPSAGPIRVGLGDISSWLTLQARAHAIQAPQRARGSCGRRQAAHVPRAVRAATTASLAARDNKMSATETGCPAPAREHTRAACARAHAQAACAPAARRPALAYRFARPAASDRAIETPPPPPPPPPPKRYRPGGARAQARRKEPHGAQAHTECGRLGTCSARCRRRRPGPTLVSKAVRGRQ